MRYSVPSRSSKKWRNATRMELITHFKCRRVFGLHFAPIFFVWPGRSCRNASAATLRCPAPLRSSRHLRVPAFVACDSPCFAAGGQYFHVLAFAGMRLTVHSPGDG
jgi:hypothetical protein